MPPPPSRRTPRVGDEDETPATKGDVRMLVRRIERLEPLQARVSDLAGELGFHRSGMDRHIKVAVRDAVDEELKPYASSLRKLDVVKEVAEKAHRILEHQEVRAQIKAEEKLNEETKKAEREAARTRRNTLLAVLAPIIVAVISALTAMAASYVH